MPERSDTSALPEQWDSYIGFVDDAPASIMLNLALEELAPLATLPVLHFWSVDMVDAGARGLGSADEAESLAAFEDRISAAAAKAGLLNVGRLRNRGYWQFMYYAAEDLSEELGTLAFEVLPENRRASLKVGTDEDPTWAYFLNFLCPTPQQRRWMSDRSVVKLFMDHGDPLTPRPVDHFAYFQEEGQARAFANIAAEQGFAAEASEPDREQEQPLWSVKVTREDAVDLGHIHSVVMTLSTIAEEIGGLYDGWGAPSVAPDPA